MDLEKTQQLILQTEAAAHEIFVTRDEQKRKNLSFDPSVSHHFKFF